MDQLKTSLEHTESKASEHLSPNQQAMLDFISNSNIDRYVMEPRYPIPVEDSDNATFDLESTVPVYDIGQYSGKRVFERQLRHLEALTHPELFTSAGFHWRYPPAADLTRKEYSTLQVRHYSGRFRRHITWLVAQRTQSDYESLSSGVTLVNGM